MEESHKIISKLSVPELKKYIKHFVKEKAIGTLKKSELLEHAMQLFESGKPKDKNMTGSGITDLFRSQKQDFTNDAQKTLDIFGDRTITSIKLFKHPISDLSRIGTDVFTLNRMQKLRKENDIDELFHIGFIITLDKNKEILLEKHHVVMIKSKFPKFPEDEQMTNVSLQGKELTLNEMMIKTIEGYKPEKFFIYNGLKQNCQNFVTAVMEYNGLLTPELHKWSNQSMIEIIKGLPFFTEHLMNLFTGTLAKVDQVLGRGRKEDNEELLATVAENQKNIKNKINEDKNIQSEEYQDLLDDKKDNRELLHDEVVTYFLEKDRYTREQMDAIPKAKLYAEYQKEKIIDKRISQGFTYNRRKNKFSLNGTEYKATDIIKMNEAAAAENEETELYKRANKMNFFQDVNNGLWYLNNESLGRRQYIETPEEAYEMGYPATKTSTGKYGVLLDAMYIMNHQYKNGAYWDYDKHSYVEFNKDLWNQIDSFTGGLLNKVLSYVPGPYNLAIKAIQNSSKFLTGSTQGDISNLVQGRGKPDELIINNECDFCRNCKCKQDEAYKQFLQYQKDRLNYHQTKRPEIIINPKLGSGFFSKLSANEASL